MVVDTAEGVAGNVVGCDPGASDRGAIPPARRKVKFSRRTSFSSLRRLSTDLYTSVSSLRSSALRQRWGVSSLPARIGTRIQHSTHAAVCFWLASVRK